MTKVLLAAAHMLAATFAHAGGAVKPDTKPEVIVKRGLPSSAGIIVPLMVAPAVSPGNGGRSK